MTTKRLEIRVDQTGNASSGLGGITRSLGTIGSLAGGVALGGIVALGAGIVGTAGAGLSLNNSMEQAQATINAFTKDGQKTEQILEMIRKRAAQTPFAFNEMATAAGALIPSANQAGVALEELIKEAEILAASNPAQGLEGAAFALKEAVSGDFTSIIERFNLPRQFINQLKEEGLPNLEIVRRAMQELGLDMDLVSSLANTAQGRWSTFKDTMQSVAAQITQPIFEAMSTGLGSINQLLTENEPLIQAFAQALASQVQVAINWLIEFIPKAVAVFKEWSKELSGTLEPAMLLVKDAIDRISVALGLNNTEISAQDVLLAALKGTLDAIVIAIKLFAISMQGAALAVEKVSEAIRIARGIYNNLAIISNHVKGQLVSHLSNIISKWIEFRNTVNNIVNHVRGVMNSLSDGINRVNSAIRSATDKWKDFRRAVRDAVDAIPHWLLPGSPTPFEIGMRGIADATGEAGRQLQRSFSNPLQTAPTSSTNTGGSLTINLKYSPAISLGDRTEAERVLLPFILNGIRGAQRSRLV